MLRGEGKNSGNRNQKNRSRSPASLLLLRHLSVVSPLRSCSRPPLIYKLSIISVAGNLSLTQYSPRAIARGEYCKIRDIVFSDVIGVAAHYPMGNTSADYSTAVFTERHA